MKSLIKQGGNWAGLQGLSCVTDSSLGITQRPGSLCLKGLPWGTRLFKNQGLKDEWVGKTNKVIEGKSSGIRRAWI